ncbi:MAG: hypothetical protein CFE44_03740 [Burkholderiales bacterium PBB4]|nr:MAG: hypothetical protein CFE44_03740 [Burkholderiales bacterium PBB4]
MPSSSLTRSPAVRRPRSRFRAALWPLLALLIGSLASLAVGIAVHQRTQADSESAFHRQVDRLQSDLARSFERPQHALNAMVGFYNASRSVERAEFDAYWEHHDIGKEFPGVRSLGFIEPVKRENLAAFIAREKADGLTDYVVQSQGEDPELLLVRHAISDNGTRAALGIDINPEPQRRAAAVKAIGTGQVTLSNPIQIKTEGSETLGFLMLQPVYRSGADPTTYAQRRAALVGLVYSAILAHDIMKPAMGDMQGLVDFDVFDGVISSGAPVVFSSSPQAARAKPRFEQDRIMEIAGLTLTVRAHSTPSFEALQDHSRAGLVGTIGMLFTLAVVGGFWLLTRGREAAENRATRIAH